LKGLPTVRQGIEASERGESVAVNPPETGIHPVSTCTPVRLHAPAKAAGRKTRKSTEAVCCLWLQVQAARSMLLPQFDDCGALAALVLVCFGHGCDVGVAAQCDAEGAPQDAHSCAVHDADPLESG
jgi:hypothetical protein